jgi:hypothetical protein
MTVFWRDLSENVLSEGIPEGYRTVLSSPKNCVHLVKAHIGAEQ